MSLSEAEIRPPDLFAEYQRLLAADIAQYFPPSPRQSATCAACLAAGEYAFTKRGFDYRWCQQCWYLWASPRPLSGQLDRFYAESESARYWADVFSPVVEAVRRERLWKPKVTTPARLLEEVGASPDAVVDIGGGTGVFAEIFRAATGCPVHVVEPGRVAAARARSRGVTVYETAFETFVVPATMTGTLLWTSFELLEHVVDPRQWMLQLSSVMSTGDWALLTTLSCAGLDIQVLWEEAGAINPPVHLNFVSPRLMPHLAEAAGLRVARVITPGEIDIDILSTRSGQIQDRFWRGVVQTASAEERSLWQELLRRTGRSSHLWALLHKP